MGRIVMGIFLTVLGAFLITSRLNLARNNIEFQNKVFGFRFGKKEVQATAFIYLLGGPLLIIMGILTLLGIFEFK